MKLLGRLLAFIILMVLVVFAVANRGVVNVSLWPLPWTLDLGVYLVVLAPFALGLLVGITLMWVSHVAVVLRSRREQRRSEEVIGALEQELARRPVPPVTQGSVIQGVDEPFP